MVSAGTAAAGALPGMAIPGGLTLPRAGEAATVWKKTPCRLCGVGCGLLVGIENGRAVAVRGDKDSPVSGGLACVKGYYSVEALTGKDRIARATIGRGGARGQVPMREALDVVARRLRETIAKSGKDSVAIYGSAQWSVTDAYIASKLFKGGLGTNNVETSARLYAASAMAGLQGTFGLDGAVGCYEDIDHADIFVLWDVNLAETDPVMFSRMLERRRRDPAVRIVEVATRTSRTSYAIDRSLLHAPQTASAIANAVCQEIVTRKWVQREFVEKYVAFKRGPTGIGYGLTTDSLAADAATDATWKEYVEFLSAYEPARAEQMSGLAAESIRFLASLYGDPQRKVMSVWGREVNEDARAAWLNELIGNIHLLVGKVASPGNGPFATNGQPSGGSAVSGAGSLMDTLPRGVVQNEADRKRAAAIWGVPVERIDAKPGAHTIEMFRRLERGEIKFLWIMATDPMVSLPNVERYRKAAAKAGAFIVVSEAYPTPTTDAADVVLPAAMWLERDGIYGNVERRLQLFERMVAPPGEAMSDAWQLIEVARRLGFEKQFAYDPSRYVEQIWEEYGRFHDDKSSALPPIAKLRAEPGVLWPYVAGRETQRRYNTTQDPAADGARGGYDFYGHADHRAWIWLRPVEPPAESPDKAYPFWLTLGAVLEQWGAGSMTQRIPTLHRALPHGYVEMNRADADELGIKNREMVRLVSKRGSVEIEARIDYRSQPPRGGLFAPWFDEARLVNTLTLDAFCPVSGQPAGTNCAVRVERVERAGWCVMTPMRSRSGRAILLPLLLIAAAVTAVAAVVVAVQRAPVREEQRSIATVAKVVPAAEPIRAEAQVFRTTPEMVSIPPAALRERSAHVRRLATVHFNRPYEGAPPRIPHGLSAEEFQTDACRTCHQRGGFSHRFAAYVPLTPHADRGMCLQCHVGVDQVIGVSEQAADPNTRCVMCHPATGGPPRADAKIDVVHHGVAGAAEDDAGRGSAAHSARSAVPRELPDLPRRIRGGGGDPHDAPGAGECRQCHVAQDPDAAPFARTTTAGSTQ